MQAYVLRRPAVQIRRGVYTLLCHISHVCQSYGVGWGRVTGPRAHEEPREPRGVVACKHQSKHKTRKRVSGAAPFPPAVGHRAALKILLQPRYRVTLHGPKAFRVRRALAKTNTDFWTGLRRAGGTPARALREVLHVIPARGLRASDACVST